MDGLLDQRDRTRKLSAQVEESKAAYVQSWEASIQAIASEDLRQKAVERREDVVEDFGKLSTQLAEVQQRLDPWVQDVVDVRAYSRTI